MSFSVATMINLSKRKKKWVLLIGILDTFPTNQIRALVSIFGYGRFHWASRVTRPASTYVEGSKVITERTLRRQKRKEKNETETKYDEYCKVDFELSTYYYYRIIFTLKNN